MTDAIASRSTPEARSACGPKTASREIFQNRRASRGRSAGYRSGASRDFAYAYEKARRVRQFLQTDPIGYEDDLNLYAYVRNDPLNAIDPSGRDAVVLARPLPFTARAADHQGILVGSDAGGRWEYRSLDGVQDGAGSPTGPADYAEHLGFESLEQAMSDPTISSYDRAYFREATPRQDAAALRNADDFEQDNRTYNLASCNCGDLVEAAMVAIDPNFPDTVNPRAASDQLGREGSGWSVIKGNPTPPSPSEESRRLNNGNLR